MAAVPVAINGVIVDYYGRTIMGPVKIVGEMVRSDVGVGGGPIYPPEGGGGSPDHIWGGGNEPFPTPPIANVPGAPGYRPPGDHIWGPTDPRPTPPIYLPPGYPGGPTVPPGLQPPEVPPPGSPTTPVPPPEGSGGWPVTPIVPPPYVVLNYPGIGPVYVTPPASPAEPTPSR